jgi:hypothetical protein
VLLVPQKTKNKFANFRQDRTALSMGRKQLEQYSFSLKAFRRIDASEGK